MSCASVVHVHLYMMLRKTTVTGHIWHDVFGAWDKNNNAYFDTVNSHTDTANFSLTSTSQNKHLHACVKITCPF